MKIITKLEIDDEFYFMNSNKIKIGTVKEIQISVLKNKTYIKYNIEFLDNNKIERKICLEEDVFKTKKELLDSL